jgi:hypothetical protein
MKDDKDEDFSPKKASPRKKSPGRSKSGTRGRSPGRKPRDPSVGRKKSPGRPAIKTPKSPKKEVVEAVPGI